MLTPCSCKINIDHCHERLLIIYHNCWSLYERLLIMYDKHWSLPWKPVDHLSQLLIMYRIVITTFKHYLSIFTHSSIIWASSHIWVVFQHAFSIILISPFEHLHAACFQHHPRLSIWASSVFTHSSSIWASSSIWGGLSASALSPYMLGNWFGKQLPQFGANY